MGYSSFHLRDLSASSRTDEQEQAKDRKVNFTNKIITQINKNGVFFFFIYEGYLPHLERTNRNKLKNIRLILPRTDEREPGEEEEVNIKLKKRERKEIEIKDL